MSERPKYYVLNDDQSLRVVDDVLTWAKEFESLEGRRVATDEPISGVIVSTVFLGVDHAFFGGPPLLFETLVFGGMLDQEMKRYSTWAEAEDGHREMVVAVMRTQAHGRSVKPSRRT